MSRSSGRSCRKQAKPVSDSSSTTLVKHQGSPFTQQTSRLCNSSSQITRHTLRRSSLTWCGMVKHRMQACQTNHHMECSLHLTSSNGTNLVLSLSSSHHPTLCHTTCLQTSQFHKEWDHLKVNIRTRRPQPSNTHSNSSNTAIHSKCSRCNNIHSGSSIIRAKTKVSILMDTDCAIDPT